MMLCLTNACTRAPKSKARNERRFLGPVMHGVRRDGSLRNRVLISLKFGKYALWRYQVYVQGQTDFSLGGYQSSVYILLLSK